MREQPNTARLQDSSARPVLALSFGAVMLAAISSIFLGEIDVGSWLLSGALGMLLVSFYPVSVSAKRYFRIAACLFLAAYTVLTVVELLRAF
jgi:hypothetical protein